VLFQEGFLAAVSNPKALLFYGAFLPQFIDPARSMWIQFVLMASTFAFTELVVEFCLARLATAIRPWLQRTGKRFNQACGGLFMLLGSALPFSR
jgi:threonine/homoserine/homoserine lactone efflux protein